MTVRNADLSHLPSHHPSDALLVAYGAGSLGEGLSLALAVHLARCPGCRERLASVEAVGGALLEDLLPTPLSDLTLATMLARLDGAPERDRGPAPRRNDAGCRDPSLPLPLRLYVPSLEGLAWRRLVPGVRRVELLPRRPSGATAQLLRVAPGTALPHHGHGGLELTVVLSGQYTDELGRYGPGDIAEADGDTRHRPVAASHQDCVSLIATDAPLRFTGVMGRLMQPFIGL